MKQYFMKTASGAALFFALTMSLSADAMQDFTVKNKTGFTITSLYASPVKDRNWGEDILGEDQLETGMKVDIKFSGYSGKTCRFDVMLKDEKDNEWIVEDINLCEIHSLAFSKKGRGVQWEAE